MAYDWILNKKLSGTKLVWASNIRVASFWDLYTCCIQIVQKFRNDVWWDLRAYAGVSSVPSILNSTDKTKSN